MPESFWAPECQNHFRPNQPLYEWSRPGIMLYGASPMEGKTGAELGLCPAMTLQAPLITTRVVRAGESVGYGASWTASQDTRMGMVAIGYADGYPRHAGTGTPAAVRGRRDRFTQVGQLDTLDSGERARGEDGTVGGG